MFGFILRREVEVEVVAREKKVILITDTKATVEKF